MECGKISIIIPVYNVEHYLDRCIDSVLRQTHSNFEALLIDDGSTDDSGDICDRWAKKDPRIRLVHHDTNYGTSEARNAGLAAASGNYIVFVDGDDYISPWFYEHMIKILLEYNVDFAACNYFLDANNTVREPSYFVPTEGIISRDDYWNMEVSGGYMFCAAVWNKLFKSHLWRDLRFRVGKYAEDSFAMTEYVQKAGSIYITKEPLYYYFQRENSLSHIFNVKNLDSVEARLERIEYYYSYGQYSLMKQGLFWSRFILCRAYKAMRNGDTGMCERYKFLRKEYKRLYLLAHKRLSFSRKMIWGSLYYLSDGLYYYARKIILRE